MSELTDTPTLVQKITAETLGTFVLVFFGCGSFVFASEAGAGELVTFTTIGLAFGLTVTVMAYAFGRISGGHFNPAVTLGAALSGRLAWREVGIYVGAQIAGAIVAGLVLFALLHGYDGFDAEGAMGQNSFGDEGSGFAWWAAFLLEAILTFLFLWVILAVTDKRNPFPVIAPLTIGLSLTLIHFVAIPATGTSVNPARSIGPGLFAGGDAIVQLWLFIVAPLLGAAIAGFTYSLVFGRDGDPVPGSGLNFSKPANQQAYAGGYQQGWDQQAPPQQGQWAAPQDQAWQQQPQAAPEGQWAAPHDQSWQQGGPPPEQQQYQQPDQYGQPPAQDPYAQPPQQEQQWPQQPPQQPGYPPQQDYGNPDEGRTQIRPPDGQS